jgi:hypothetical protein
MRTKLSELGQIEIDELYVALDKNGVHYIVSVQAKGKRDKLSVVQIEQDFEFCMKRFPNLIPKPIGAQFISEDIIALFELEVKPSSITVANERHYRLVAHSEISDEDLRSYKNRIGSL